MLTLIAVVAGIIAIVIVANWRLEFFKWDLRDEFKKEMDKKIQDPPKVEHSPAPEPAKVVEPEPVASIVEPVIVQPEVTKIKEEQAEQKPAPVPVAEVKPQRTRDSKGKFVKDNPSTPVNEAWVGGTKPSKPVKRGPRKSKK